GVGPRGKDDVRRAGLGHMRPTLAGFVDQATASIGLPLPLDSLTSGNAAIARGVVTQRSQTTFADLNRDRTFIDPDGAPPEPRGDRERRRAPGVGIEDEVARVCAGENESLEQGLRFLRRVPGSLPCDRSDDADVPYVAERRAGGRLFGR